MTRHKVNAAPSFPVILLKVVLALFALSQQNCTNAHSEGKSAFHREAAQRYLQNKQLKEALLEFKNAARYAPTDATIQYQIALTALQFDEPAFLMDAYEALRKTVDLDPKNKDAQLKLGALYLLSQKPVEALACAEKILEVDPSDAEGLSLRGHAYLRERRVGQGLGDLKRTIELHPSTIRFYVDLARAYVQMNMLADAGRVLEQARRIEPNSIDVQLSLADYYLISYQLTEAEIHYREALSLAPSNETIYVKLAEFYQAIHRWSEAESALRTLVSLRPHSAKPLLQLGDLYAFLGRHDQAIAAFRGAVDIERNSLIARNRLVSGLLDASRTDEAETLIADIRKHDGNDADGRLFSGRVHLIRGNLRQAHDLLQGVVNDRPWFASGHHFLGLVHAREDDLALARQELLDSLKLDDKNLPARLALAMVYFREGSHDLATEQALRVLRANPGHAHAAIIISDAYLASQQWDKASSILQPMVNAVPHDPQVEYRLGLLSLARGKKGQALSHFESALQADGRFIEPLERIADALFLEGKNDVALQRVAAHLGRIPDHSPLHRYYAALLDRAGLTAQAEAAYKQAIALDDRNIGAYFGLGKLYQSHGRTDEAVREYETVLKKNPRFNSARMLLAISYEGKQDYARAQAFYEDILNRDPRHGAAANNLAFLLVQEGGNLDLALSYAQIARELMPNDPFVADTLGWIYYHKKAFKRSVNLLREASERVSTNAIVQYHLGLALLKSGQTLEARKILERSLALDRNFLGSNNAKAILAEM